MKRTKKLSIALSSVALIIEALGGNIPIRALDELSAAANIDKPADQLSLVKNDINAYLKLDSIRYKEGDARGTVTAPKEGDWYIKKILVAYMNFGQGVTEEQADQNLASFIAAGDDWVVLSRYEPFPAAARQQQNISLNQNSKVSNAYVNKSDIFYYAVEFGKITDNGTWGETWWSRGKIDYRECVHSGVFLEDTMICQRYKDGNTVRYVPKMTSSGELVMQPENESVVTWKEEWKDVIQTSYEAVQIELEQMHNYLNNGLNILDKDYKVLDGIEKSLKNYAISDPKLSWMPNNVTSRKGMITEMRKFYEKTDSTSVEIMQEEIESLKTEVVSLKQEKASLETEKDELVQEKTVLVAKKWGIDAGE